MPVTLELQLLAGIAVDSGAVAMPIIKQQTSLKWKGKQLLFILLVKPPFNFREQKESET